MPSLLRIATLLGAGPLLLGTLIYGAWRQTRWHWLELAGACLLAPGFGAVIAGSVALIWHLRRESRAARTARRSPSLHSVVIGILLLSNFPAAAFYTWSAIEVSTRYTVRILNESGRTIESLTVIGPGVRVEMGPIGPGEHAEEHFHFEGDGALEFSARQGELHFIGEIDGYVTGGMRGNNTVRVRPEGAYTIEATPPN